MPFDVPPELDHERQDVYRAALQFVPLAKRASSSFV
jgi:hypothetical protein